MLVSMCISIIFIVVDVLSVLGVFRGALPTGLNPFWKISFVCKCFCDAVILDDFKTALDKLRDYWLLKNATEPINSEPSSRHNDTRRRRSHGTIAASNTMIIVEPEPAKSRNGEGASWNCTPPLPSNFPSTRRNYPRGYLHSGDGIV
ncbi:hypothetical protein H112_07820 [Trichophyton rubrum D6]|uniref:Uncharacterized protein n=2 Tax=Trichophyton rubrum TaxID=5551 RepID=A0A080WGE4_TRIRC|nr:uncharacterized protein TERG_11566 [Trichophyton rubrum CBS 118892]EZF10902.1 hypothetical protein H100_07847 [Trichophyton rubrum MR850]EZF37769.1 hypothetical protein H102_07807 [Trichophyton rubrum CBS 100081]EZF48502.1 hypothetical protein H103_07832 [Trichophyton rubrum CBS 288.86]EZF59252.1 hypothetical protein H104_07779 [Trichophyton rubrum CBS 289.86]EZF80448.1 hypothetical protein H110_07829 [Trichophyton rubrum MR1448]EZF91105.1 hypothetical protein H113_07887 [Trichophyton rubr